ncbi:phosphatidylglycerophosphatase A [Rhodobacteraceae bacterium 2CG4]|uniref:Phosphatidylglycerophosphatase A n=1 Tax=Halovulum marinum TaxID=2662447 RepID=A0A6L5Z604_9RHOB|nr:phosphatidylglycerophosphatase A [Halovulum marinum]MSU91422.1 phosphatidylglycerophosphatase A [Halovulum marinum]
MIRAIASVGFVGLIPFAPGTFGSLAALPGAWVLHALGGFPLLAAATLLVFVLGLWAVGKLPPGSDHDPSWVVIDEVAGQWIALFPLSAGLWYAGAAPWTFPWPGWVGAFLMFRLFDIWKPWLVGRADALPGPLGVMLDDVVAGVLAALAVALAAAVAHGAFGA